MEDPWEITVSSHALARVMERFDIATEEEAVAFIREQLLTAEVARKRPGGALRWNTDEVQVVTSSFQGNSLNVLTVYPHPAERKLRKQMKTRLREHRLRRIVRWRRQRAKDWR